jgi:hypothetical protein
MQRHLYEWPSLAENWWPNHGRKLTGMTLSRGHACDIFGIMAKLRLAGQFSACGTKLQEGPVGLG